MKGLEKLVFDKLENYPDRIKHIKGVISVSEELASIYKVDTYNAKIAALFHDFTKQDSIEEQMKYLDEDIIKKYSNFEFVYHAYSAAKYLSELMPNLDKDVYNAIRYHIWGRENMTTLEKILLVSDKCEPNRKYPAAKKIYKLALINLDQAVAYTLKSMNDHLRNIKVEIHPEQLKTYNYYVKEKI